jgi:hypothetical protein
MVDLIEVHIPNKREEKLYYACFEVAGFAKRELLHPGSVVAERRGQQRKTR